MELIVLSIVCGLIVGFGVWLAMRPTMDQQYRVHANWNEDACAWVATSDDVPGLVTEADSLDLLKAKIMLMGPDLMAANTAHKLDKVSLVINLKLPE